MTSHISWSGKCLRWKIFWIMKTRLKAFSLRKLPVTTLFKALCISDFTVMNFFHKTSVNIFSLKIFLTTSTCFTILRSDCIYSIKKLFCCLLKPLKSHQSPWKIIHSDVHQIFSEHMKLFLTFLNELEIFHKALLLHISTHKRAQTTSRLKLTTQVQMQFILMHFVAKFFTVFESFF